MSTGSWHVPKAVGVSSQHLIWVDCQGQQRHAAPRISANATLAFVWEIGTPNFCARSVALFKTCLKGYLCGRRGTWWHPTSFCVTGMALMALSWVRWRAWVPLSPWSPRLFAWQAWHLVTSTVTLRGRRGTVRWRAWVPLSPWSPRLFAWQVWHLVTNTHKHTHRNIHVLFNIHIHTRTNTNTHFGKLLEFGEGEMRWNDNRHVMLLR